MTHHVMAINADGTETEVFAGTQDECFDWLDDNMPQYADVLHYVASAEEKVDYVSFYGDVLWPRWAGINPA